ncbi:hypothetical protein LTR70_006504 [Exophiala xenobiotica]|uniref:CENP-V/GFA domain-containing protein n=1 Tax=Lithohypha guttulata TaxID=1690604 RepID=A0ABR0JXN3_9EURO|nr:hypothetical protein LTR24_009213 [Lithohypha guttulata]KAK5315952.1 hypothetical protein LTR70_006504 [Exophiala xenobiotica]
MSSETPISPTTGKAIPRSQYYEGGCHCGNVRYTVKLSPPLDEMPVTQCTCSICHINGQLMVYPLESQIEWHSGKDSMTPYSFGPSRIAHTFCPVCGTSIGGKGNDPTFFANNRALNVRTFRNVDLTNLHIRPVDGRKTMTSKEYQL